MDSKTYRIREFFNPGDNRSLIVETSGGLSLGPMPGLENFSTAITPLLPLVDGVVSSPGQSRKLTGRTRQDAALLIRGDWTNALRGSDFVLPPETISYIPLLTPQEALDMGASAIVLYFLLGHDEAIEARCLHQTVQTAIAGSQVGVPLIVDVQPIGERVVMRSKAIELGVSYALEGGADGVAIPWPGSESFKTILTMAAGIPIWVKISQEDDTEGAYRPALEMGAAGLWLGEFVFAQANPEKITKDFCTLVHRQSTSETNPKI